MSDSVIGEEPASDQDKVASQADSKQENHVNGVLMTSDSGNDPSYYLKKQQVEARLGRTLTTDEFQREYYEGPESIFDPVLCELAYRWFCNRQGSILDPFAGGSVRGIVAGRLGYDYTGIELREEQVAANRQQGEKLLAGNDDFGWVEWIEGDSSELDELLDEGKRFDFVFSCPLQRHARGSLDDGI